MKKILVFLLVLSLCLGLIACAASDKKDETPAAPSAAETTEPAPETEVPTEAPETEAPETEVPETEAPETEAPETEAPETEAPQTEAPETEFQPEYPEDETLCFPYEQPDFTGLSDGAWEAYEEIYPKIVALEDFYYDVETYGYSYMDDLLSAFAIIRELHPETRNYFMLEEDMQEVGDEWVFGGMRSHYFARWDPELSEDKEEIRTAMEAFEQRTQDILAGITEDMSAYERYYYLATVISENASYDYEFVSDADDAPWAGVMGGICICEGYAEAMAYLCQRADLYCTVVSGSSRGVSHAWNLVKLPYGTYHIDVTWADEGGLPGSEGWLRYFMLTQDQILEDHIIIDGTVATGD